MKKRQKIYQVHQPDNNLKDNVNNQLTLTSHTGVKLAATVT
jgi:hypothetical protein